MSLVLDVRRLILDHPQEHRAMSAFASRFEGRGIRLGEERGMRIGEQRGEAAVLLRQLRIRFGPLPESVCERIQDTDAETLLLWSERILSAHSLEEVVA